MWDELNDLVESLEPALQRAVLVAVARMKTQASRRALELAWANADADAVVYLLMGEASSSWQPLKQAVAQAIQQAAVDHVMVSIRPGGPLLNILTGVSSDPRILQSIDTSLITQIDRSTRQALGNWVREAIREGVNPETAITQMVGVVDPRTGARVGGVLGLTDRQTQAVVNFRRMLQEQRFKEALTRELRDGRFDATLWARIQNGGSLTDEQIDRMVARYEARMLAYRARTIARTESAVAHAEGQRQAWTTAIQQGRVNPNLLIKRWVTANDERVRAHHAELHNAIIPYDKFYIVRGGSLKNPRISQVFGPPHEPNCRCVLSIRPILDPNTIFHEYAHVAA